MDYTKKVAGRINFIGNVILNAGSKKYAVINLIDASGTEIELKDVLVTNYLNNHLKLSADVEFLLIDGKAFGSASPCKYFISALKINGKTYFEDKLKLGFSKNFSIAIGFLFLLTPLFPISIYLFWKSYKINFAIKEINNFVH